jgi:hypothetical protein
MTAAQQHELAIARQDIRLALGHLYDLPKKYAEEEDIAAAIVYLTEWLDDNERR